ncbi:pentapeptide repeat-containing protein [Pleurocapsales cyanobacterium LEGE 06147]|nr:pentapeptide repeat-containing protein [Pleurocapsales cyanobacterium LEGE 06147]
MSYCLNPSCPQPINHPKAKVCKACGSKLLLRARYHLVKGLGKGGFGATFLAADLSLPGNPLCVIKQLRPNTNNPQFLLMARELFEREARTLGTIGNHPQIPRLLDYFEDRKQFYLVQEFVKGSTLQQEVKKNGILNEDQVKQVLQEILTILKDIHAQKVIHRDIKPANIIRREIDDKLVLIDFGVVKNQVNSIGAANSDQTALTAFAVGTPGFAPPEQLAMRPVYASDIYALGVTCMYLLSGKAPKKMECDPITGEIDWLRYINVSNSFAEILKTMLEVSVRNRYKSAQEVLRALDMEDHMDSLAESMIKPPNSSFNQPNTSFSNRHTSFFKSGRRMSSSSGMTDATRSRSSFSRTTVPPTRGYDRTSTTNRGSQTFARRQPLTGARNFSESKRPSKIDGATLLSAYASGRRDFGQKDISLQDLQKANLAEVNFQQSRLIKVNLQGADLTSADLSGADLRQAMLRNANLGRAYLNFANLEGTDLRGADLSFAHLKDAKLKGANLCGANLTNTDITQQQLAQAKTNWTTILPNGKRGFW